jgi:hypothetical protein
MFVPPLAGVTVIAPKDALLMQQAAIKTISALPKLCPDKATLINCKNSFLIRNR